MNKISKTVLLFGIFTVVATFLIGFYGYKSSHDTLLQHVYKNNLELSRLFRDYVSSPAHLLPESLAIENIRKLWQKIDRPFPGGFVCVIDRKGNLTLHTAAPDREGVSVKNKSMEKLQPDGPDTLGELVLSKQDWVGPYVSSAGHEQVAAFSYVPNIDSVVSVHVPIDAIEKQINESTLPWIVGFVILGVFLFPSILFVLHKAYISAQKDLSLVNTDLKNEIRDRLIAEENLSKFNDELESRVKERTEEIVIAKNEAEEANQFKTEFLGRMSHELRTPLNAILGFGQLLNVGKLDSNSHEYTNEIIMAGKHLLGLIDEVLDLAKIESGQCSINNSNVSLYEIIYECISMTIQQVDEKHINLINKVLPSDEHYLYADRLKLKEVIVNLITNATKYNTENGSVIISAEPNADKVRINIQDTGPGIPEEKHKHVFEPFNRIGAEYTDIEGTGIGLTISKKFMELMGGEIGVISTNGNGCTFWVECQRSSVDTTKTQEKTESLSATQSAHARTILYVEDNPANLRLVERIIKRHTNMVFMSALNAEDGIEIARLKKPDLIIMDLNLPGMDGYQALSVLRNHEETSDIPVIALSAKATPRDIERGYIAGFRRYLTKPLQIDEFIDTIKTCGTINISDDEKRQNNSSN